MINKKREKKRNKLKIRTEQIIGNLQNKYF
jgi:hypothetical protein